MSRLRNQRQPWSWRPRSPWVRRGVVWMSLGFLVSTTWVVAQSMETRSPPDAVDSEPSAASPLMKESEQLWLDQRHSQLTAQIQHLERVESTLGKKHPSMREVQAELESLRSQLSTWKPSQLPEAVSTEGALDELNDTQLRRLLLQMAIKVDRLETRIGVLERRQRQR
ncbi:MAG: hypothetical protein AAF670_15020 [Planctomycetota bacterium]